MLYQLRDCWVNILNDADISSQNYVTLDVQDWLGRAALDTICEAGFGYQCDSVHDTANELASAFHNVFAAVNGFDIIGIATGFFPALKYLVSSKNLKA